MVRDEKHILVIDDEEKIIEVVRSYLENAGYTVFSALTGRQGLELFERVDPDLVVLDLMLPDLMGEEVCKNLRRKSRVPIIMLTAKVGEEDKLTGLDIGADDYMTKPFSPRELVGRVRAILRRTADEKGPLANLLSFNQDDLQIDLVKREVLKNGEVVNLTPNEYKILTALAKYPKRVFTREELVNTAMGLDFEGYERSIDSHIKNLRQKIENDTRNPEYILTVHGVGYKFGV